MFTLSVSGHIEGMTRWMLSVLALALGMLLLTEVTNQMIVGITQPLPSCSVPDSVREAYPHHSFCEG